MKMSEQHKTQQIVIAMQSETNLCVLKCLACK